MRHVGAGDVWSTHWATEMAARQRRHWREHGFGWRAAVDRATGAAVGFVALELSGRETAGLARGEHEIGWWLTPAAWGRGLAREGAIAVRDDAFRTVRAPSVVARVQAPNERSIAVATSLGLSLDTTVADGTGRDVNVYRLTADEWRDIVA